MVMPEGMTGMDLADRVSAEKPDLKIVPVFTLMGPPFCRVMGPGGRPERPVRTMAYLDIFRQGFDRSI
jgi:hypothetical protein